MTKALLNKIFNNRKVPVKVTGIIVGSPASLSYVVKTRSGKMRVQAATVYQIGDRVAVFDGLIQGYAGKESTPTSVMV